MQYEQVLQQCIAVLDMNDRQTYTQPAHGLYPHQWLWDSCFIAIGLKHRDTGRAQQELISLMRGQWSNGMMPNIIFRTDRQYRTDRNIWRSWLSPYAPDQVATTGITQPPMLAEAVVQIGAMLAWPERRSWYRQMYPALLAYHQWLYNDRDPHQEGLVLQIHPWETGLDNTPPWTHEMHEHQFPAWISLIEKTGFDKVLNLFRRDARSVPVDERYSTIEALLLFDMQRRFRRKAYDSRRILDHNLVSIEDVAFNAIFIRANTHLRHIAKSLRRELPSELLARMKKTEQAFEDLWDPASNEYYSRDFLTHQLLKIPTVAGLLALYSGSISKQRAALLVKKIENEEAFGPAFPLPSVPLNSFWFHPRLYWQGPTWVNINWLVINGLRQYGYNDHADALSESTIEMVGRGGCSEYFNPITGDPAGAANFSWTAALTIDLIKSAEHPAAYSAATSD